VAHKEFESIDDVQEHLNGLVSILEGFEKVSPPVSLGPQKMQCLVRAVQFLAEEVQALKTKAEKA